MSLVAAAHLLVTRIDAILMRPRASLCTGGHGPDSG